jgi:hypothetical protein
LLPPDNTVTVLAVIYLATVLIKRFLEASGTLFRYDDDDDDDDGDSHIHITAQQSSVPDSPPTRSSGSLLSRLMLPILPFPVLTFSVLLPLYRAVHNTAPVVCLCSQTHRLVFFSLLEPLLTELFNAIYIACCVIGTNPSTVSRPPKLIR